MTSRAASTISRATVAFASIGLLVSGCALASPTAAPTVAPESTTLEVVSSESARQMAAFPDVYAQELGWHPCGPDAASAESVMTTLRQAGGRVEGMECVAIQAPLDWNNPDESTRITLAAVRIPSTGDGEPIGSLLSNPGGPGASGVDFALGMALSPHYAAVQDQYDFIGFDPRGIAGSSAVQCEEVSTIFELNLAACAAREPLASSMGTAQVARDMDLIRHLLGDDTLHYLGMSYGTTIGASYVTLFPERVGRMLLDSAWASKWSTPLGVYQQAEAISRATLEMLADCEARYGIEHCAPSDEAAYLAVRHELDAAPLTASDGTTIDGRKFQGYLTTGLYQLHSGREQVLSNAGRALAGDSAAVDAIAAAMSGGGSSVNLTGMVVRCLSTPHDPHVLDVVNYIRERGLPASLGGPEVNDSTLRQWIDLSCDALPDSGEDYLDFVNDSDETVLVLSLTGDHATPYAGAVELVEELGNARLVTLDGSGHIASFSGRSSCVDEIANAFMLRGELPAAGMVCHDD